MVIELIIGVVVLALVAKYVIIDPLMNSDKEEKKEQLPVENHEVIKPTKTKKPYKPKAKKNSTK